MRAAGSSVAHLDRKKHDFDVMERVLGGVRDDDAPHADVVHFEVRPWVAGTTASVVEVTVLGRSTEEPIRRRDDDDDR